MSYKDYDPHFVLLRKDSKLPAVKYKNRTFTQEEILSHLKKGGNLGLLTQPNFVFVDIDNSVNHENANGLNSFWKWCDNHDIDLEKLLDETLVQETASGGLHLVFLRPKNLNLKQDINFLNGVDIKASKNNYIVIQPSTINGKKYHFYDNEKDPIELPETLAKAIEQQSKTNEKKKRKVKIDEPEDGLLYHSKYTRFPALDIFYNIQNGFGPEGTRNDNLLKWGSAMRKITTYEVALKCAKIANQNTENPIEEDELERTLKSSYSYEYIPKIETINGIDWVVLEKDKKSADDYAVLKSKYDEVGSRYAKDYLESDLYAYGLIYAGRKDIPTVYNYEE